ncbi:hypothetical protein B0A48_17687 [Cryoendolithus antarcticus]|uniref:Protein dml1 n=1 Tax=Cryoendolithus antarcticus TaxID=1507870 RepID=A0A1V8SBA4_9PEZI|nr:hypothetical protein B0A48_17687 [Cryoendolithus antarcticus]
MHEIVTLQFGQQANYVGTHYWNTQEAYFTYEGQEESPIDHDISFVPGFGADGSDTYTPRTLIYDLKGAFGTLRRENALYEQHVNDPAQLNLWNRDAVTLRNPPIQPSPYQQALEAGHALPALTTETVRFWSDYNHVYYHPKSIVQLNEFELNSSLMPFENYATGEELFRSLDREHDLLDRDLRPFLEACDQLQAVQIFTTTDDAWGGFTARYLERIADELGKGTRWVFALENSPATTRSRRFEQMTQAAESVYSIVPSASMYVPLKNSPNLLGGMQYDARSRWHTSALQAAVLETSTLSGRLRSGAMGHASLDEVETSISSNGQRPVVETSCAFRDPLLLSGAKAVNGDHDTRMANGHINGHAEDEEAKSTVDFMPDMPSMHSRHHSVPRLGTTASAQVARGPWYSSLEIQEADMNARDRYLQGTRTFIHQTEALFQLLSSYPSIFRYPDSPDKLAVKTSLSSSTRVNTYLSNLAEVARASRGMDDHEAVYHGLASMAEEYVEDRGGLSSGDSDDD